MSPQKMKPAEREQWLRLMDMADRINTLTPWSWMGVTECFGVLLPGMQEPCTVLFNGGKQTICSIRFLLGWKAFYEMITGMAKPDAQEITWLLEIRMIELLYAEKRQLFDFEQQLLRKLRRMPDADGKIPVFRSIIPGYHPWLPDQQERDLLEAVLYQTLGMALRVESQPDLLSTSFPHELLFREQDQAGEWHDRRVPVKDPVNEDVEVHIDRQRVMSLTNKPFRPITLQVDLFFTPLAIQADKQERPQTTYVLLAVDANSGFIYSGELLHATKGVPQMWAGIPERLLAAFEKMAGCPRVIEVQGDRMANLLRPLSEMLSFKMVRRERLDLLEKARESLKHTLKKHK